jgi:Ca2+/Na+ antiporter
MNNRHNLIAYLATLAGIILLALSAAAVCIWCPANSEVALARVLGALAFISAAITGLIGVIGTFKATQAATTTQNVTNADTVTAPAAIDGSAK